MPQIQTHLRTQQPIINPAQNFVGANNINRLEPVDSFVSRRNGGEDAAEGRFVYTKLSALTRVILSTCDDGVLIHHERDGKAAEPVVYMPVLTYLCLWSMDATPMEMDRILLSLPIIQEILLIICDEG